MAFLGKTQKSTSITIALPKGSVALKFRDLFIVSLILSGLLFAAPVLIRASNAAYISVCAIPFSLAYDPLKNYIVIACDSQCGPCASKGIEVVNAATQTVVMTMTFSSFDPRAAGYNPTNQEIFVAGENGANTEVLILNANTFSTVTTLTLPAGGGISSFAYDPANSQMLYSMSGVGLWAIDSSNIATQKLSSGGLSLAYDPASQDIYMSFGSSVEVIDSSTYGVVTTLSLNGDGLGYNPSNQEMYLGDWSAQLVHVIDGSTNTPITSLSTTVCTTGPHTEGPEGFVYDPFTQDMYAVTTGSNGCGIINTISNKDVFVGTIYAGIGEEEDLGGWSSLALFDPVNSFLYFINGAAGLYYIFESKYALVQETTVICLNCPKVGMLPFGVYNHPHHLLYFPEPYDNTIAEISTTSGRQIGTLQGFSSPTGVAFDSKNLDLYVSNSNGMVSVVNSGTGHLIKNIPVGTSPGALLYDPSNGDVYTANYGSNAVSVISTVSNNVITRISVGGGPDGIALDSRNQNLYVSDYLTGMVSVISGKTNTLVATISIGGNPQGIAFDSVNHDIYAARKDGALTLINDQTNMVVNTIRLGTSLYGIVFDSSDRGMFVTDSGGGKIYVLDGSNNLAAIVFTGATPSGLPYSPFGIVYDPDNKFVYVGVTQVGGTSASVWKIGS